MKSVTVIDRRTGLARTMLQKHADVLVKLGRVDYKRRDMKAQDDAAAIDEAPAKKAKKRAYKRRDMKAED